MIFKLAISIMFLSAAQATALEVFLNENRSETGTIGFVNIDKVFGEYSGTLLSKKELENEISKKETELEKQRKKIYELKAEAAKLKQEKELALVLPEMIETKAKADAAAEKIKKENELIQKQTEEQEKLKFIQEAKQKGLTEKEIEAKLEEKFSKKDTDENKEQNPQSNTQSTKIQDANISQIEKEPYTTVPLPSLPESPYGKKAEAAKKAPVYTVAIAGIGDFNFSVSTEPAKIEFEIKRIEEKIQKNEAALTQFEKQAESDLASYEEAQTRQLLGKIYTALKRLSEQEEISVVVDKRNILYGKNTVDLTQKLLTLLDMPEEEE